MTVTAQEQLVSELIDRVELLDEDLALKLSDAVSGLTVECENRVVVHHGEQILAVIEGRGYTGRGNTMLYDESRIVRLFGEAS